MSLKIRNLYKKFDGNTVLEDVSLQVNQGEIVTIIGPSGAGKTTLLRCINHLEQCDGGTIEIGSQYLCKDSKAGAVYCSKGELAAIRKKIGYVFQSFHLFPHLSVLENLMAALIQVNGMKRETAEKKAMDLLVQLDLGEKARMYPYQLSGGQQQRVAIARACALEPMVMCFDEPTSALDPEMRGGIVNIIQGLATQKMAILIITHDMVFAKAVSHRIIFLENGRLMAEGKREHQFKDLDNERLLHYVNVE